MDGIVDSVGGYLSSPVRQSFATFPFFGEAFEQWFHAWTLNYMVWWIAWAPFVGVFVARISRGRTIREFVLGAAFVLAMFSTGGKEDPPVRIKLIWGVILAALGLAMMLTGDTGVVRTRQR